MRLLSLSVKALILFALLSFLNLDASAQKFVFRLGPQYSPVTTPTTPSGPDEEEEEYPPLRGTARGVQYIYAISGVTNIDVAVPVTGGKLPYSFSMTNKPDGIILDAANARIRGVPLNPAIDEAETHALIINDAKNHSLTIPYRFEVSAP